MKINGLVEKVEVRPVEIKNGPKAGTTSYVRTATIGGVKVDFGFKKAPAEGTKWSGEVSDTPNRFGKHELGTEQLSSGGSADISPQPGQNGAGVPYTARGGKAFPIDKTDHATSICRQSALKAAVDCLPYMLNGHMSTDEVANTTLELAARFAKWTTGQAEVEEAERIIRESTHVMVAEEE